MTVLRTSSVLAALRRWCIGALHTRAAGRWLLAPMSLALGLIAFVAPDLRVTSARPVPARAAGPVSAPPLVVRAEPNTALPCSNDQMSFMNGCPSADTVPANSSGNTWQVLLLNETSGPLSGTLSCDRTGQVSSCSLLQETYSIPGNESIAFDATFAAGAPGTGTLTVTASHAQQPIAITLNVTSWVATYTVAVSPDGASVGRPAFSTVVDSFTVQRTGNTGTIYTLSAVCTPPATNACSAPASVNLTSATSAIVPVSYTTGSAADTGKVRLMASYPNDNAVNDDGSIVVAVGAGGPAATVVSVAEANADVTPERDLCLTVAVVADVAFECGDLRVAHPLTPARTMNTVRAPTLIYNSRFAQAAPLLAAHVTLASGAGTPSKVTADLKVKSLGVWVTRASGEWQGNDFVAGRPTRIALSFDASADATGLYEYRYEVTVWTGGVPGPVITSSSKYIHVNRGASYFGAGWWVAGLEELILAPGGGFAWVGGDGSARHYLPAGTGVWVAAGVDRPDTLLQDGSGYLRVLPHGLVVRFNSSGRHTSTVNRLGHVTQFAYDGSGRLQQITLPIPATAIGTRYCPTKCLPSGTPPSPPVPAPVYSFAYPSGQVVVTAPPSPTSSGNQTREFLVSMSGGIVTSIRDPDLNTVAFDYGTGGNTRRMNSRTDRRGTRTRFAYGSGHLLNYASVDSALNVPWIETRFDTVAAGRGLADPGIVARAVAVSDVMTFVDGPRPNADALDHTRFWVDRFGAPVKTRNALGRETKLTRGDARFPALVTELRAANGFTTWATYDARGNIATSTALNPLGDGRNARTAYAWNQRFDFIERITLPEGEISRFLHDPGTGSRLWQEDGRGSMSHVHFEYYKTWGSPGGPGVLRAIVRPGGARDSIAYDSLTNLSGVKSPSGGWVTYANDRAGRLSITRTQIDASNWQHDSVTAYDLMDRVTRSVSFGPALPGMVAQKVDVLNEYDPEGNLKSVKRISIPDTADIDTVKTQWHYDRIGRRVAEISPDLEKDSTRYDLAGNPIEIVTRRDSVVRMEYDALNRLIERVVPSVTYASRDQGISTLNLAAETPPNYPRYALDPATGSLTILAEVQTFAFDSVGNMTVADNNDARIRRSYYPNGLLKTDSLRIRTYLGTDFNQHAYGILHRYDLNGRRTVSKHPWQLAPRVAGVVKDSVRYEYDSLAGYLNRVYDVLGNKYDFVLNGRNERIKMVFAGNIVDSAGYDPSGRLTSHRIFNREDTAEFPHPHSVLRNDTLTYDLRDKVVKSAGRQGFADTTTTKYSGLGHAIEFDFSAPAMSNYGIASRVVTKERIKLDALGNSFSLFDSTNAQGGSGNMAIRTRSLSYQSGTGRLIGSGQSGREDAYEYDAAGNTVFFWQATYNQQLSPLLENRASFYAIDGRLRAADYRKVWTVQGQPSNTWWWDTWFEEFRYDALGRRVLVRQRKNCPEQGDGPLHWCTLSWIRRTVWDDGEELYEIQMPGGNDVSAGTLENDTLFVHRDSATAPPYLSYFDANPQYGRVAYLHATGIDVPLSIVRINYEDLPWNQIYQTWEPFVIVPHWNWREHAEYGTYGDGSYKHCKSFNPDRCVQVQWMTKAFAFQDPASDTLDSWIGTLTQEKRDATGTHYRRSRYVDLSTGRFTQEDPIGLAGGLNVYGFAAGDPINFSDPFGLCPDCIFDIFAIAADVNDIRKNGLSWGNGAALAADVLAAALPGIPAGAGILQRGARNPVVRAAITRGNEAHDVFYALKQAEGGWNVNKTLGKGRLRPDAWRREGNTIIVEDLKPNTASGRRAAEAAQDKYRRAAAEECPTCRYEFRATYYNP